MKILKERPPLESSVEQYLIDRVEALGGKTIKLAGAEAGTLDRLVKLPRTPAFLIEVKRPKKEPTTLQLLRIREWHGVGMSAYWANSRTMVDDILAAEAW